MIRVNAPEIYKEYRIPAITTNGSAPQLLALIAPTNGKHRAIVEAKSDDIVFKFGPDNTTLADKTVTANALADGNFTVTQGMAIEIDLPDGTTGQYCSVQGFTGNGTGIVRLIKPQG